MFDIRRAAVHHALGGTAVVGLPNEVLLPDGALKGVINMMFHSGAAQTPILAAGSALALMTAVLGDIARAETNLDASSVIPCRQISPQRLSPIPKSPM